jgi:DNA-binding NarL/FixJ family response regulator
VWALPIVAEKADSGGTVCSRFGQCGLESSIQHRSNTGRAEEITSRETDVLRMLAEGSVNKDIAARLGISEHTQVPHQLDSRQTGEAQRRA